MLGISVMRAAEGKVRFSPLGTAHLLSPIAPQRGGETRKPEFFFSFFWSWIEPGEHSATQLVPAPPDTP